MADCWSTSFLGSLERWQSCFFFDTLDAPDVGTWTGVGMLDVRKMLGMNTWEYPTFICFGHVSYTRLPSKKAADDGQQWGDVPRIPSSANITNCVSEVI